MKLSPIVVLKSFCCLILAFCIAVQYNDPDRWLWIAIYGSGFLICATDLAGALPHRGIPIAASMLSFTIAIYIILATDNMTISSLFGSWTMDKTGIEEAREAGGLAIQAIILTAIGLLPVKESTE